MTLVRGSLLPALVVSVLCVVVGGVVEGREGVVGAVLGAVIVGVFFVSSPLTLGSIGRAGPLMFMAVAVLLFFAKMAALLVLVAFVLEKDRMGRHLDELVFGVTIVVMTLAWTMSMVRAAANSRQPIFDLDAKDDEPS